MTITEQDLLVRARAAFGPAARITIVDNACTVLRHTRTLGGGMRLRVHRVFLSAPPRVVDALFDWFLKPSSGASRIIDRYVHEKQDEMRLHLRRKPRALSRGRHVDLAAAFQQLNRRYFSGALDCRIGFASGARRRRARRRRTLQYGSYDAVQNIIRIHPVLDAPWIARAFLDFIIYHEMLHAAIEIEFDGCGRRRHHGKEFRRREREFEVYAEARAFEKANFRRMLAAASNIHK